MPTSLLIFILFVFPSFIQHQVQSVPSPRASATNRLSPPYHASFASLTNQDTNSLKNFDPPPFVRGSPTVVVDGSECKTNCIVERLGDCDACFSTAAATATCKSYIKTVAALSVIPAAKAVKARAAKAVKALKATITVVTSPRCSGMIACFTDDKRKMSLKLPSHERLAVKGLGYLLSEVIGDELNTTVREENAKLIYTSSPRSTPLVPFRVRIEVFSSQVIRQNIVKTALAKLETRPSLQGFDFTDFNVVNVEATDDNRYAVILEFTKMKFLEF